jgi:hypothetical protein
MSMTSFRSTVAGTSYEFTSGAGVGVLAHPESRRILASDNAQKPKSEPSRCFMMSFLPK